MRIAVTGLTGQVVSSLIERAPNNVEMLALGRPGFDLSSRDAVLASLRSVRCDAIVNAAAYTQVDKAESEPELAMRINGAGAGFVAETAALFAIMRRLVDDPDPQLRGVFHITGAGEATWADMAEAIFAAAEARGRKPVRVKRITTADYPTPARRPP